MSALLAVPARAVPRTPNLYLVGAPKSGTTSLYHYLDQHPQIFMSPLKEPNFHSEEIRLANLTEQMRRVVEAQAPGLRAYLDGHMSTKFTASPVTEYSDYARLFQNVKAERVVGEASVCYLWSPSAPENIARTCPEAKILMILRDPADRAYSQYLHMLTVSKTFLPFRDYVDACVRSSSTQIGALYPFLHFGRYFEQVTRYLKCFPRQQVLILFYDDYQRNPLNLVRNIFEFLDVDADFLPDMHQRHMVANVPRAHRLHRFLHPITQLAPLKKMNTPRLRRGLKRLAFRSRESMSMEARDRAFLVDFYRQDVERLSGLVDRDLNAWLL
jgi:hypothetical protein